MFSELRDRQVEMRSDRTRRSSLIESLERFDHTHKHLAELRPGPLANRLYHSMPPERGQMCTFTEYVSGGQVEAKI